MNTLPTTRTAIFASSAMTRASSFASVRSHVAVLFLSALCVGTVALADEESADSAYRKGREALRNDDYRGAAEAFADAYDEAPEGETAPDALYWQAFSLYRLETSQHLQAAIEVLTTLRADFPEQFSSDAEALETRIHGALASKGNAESAKRVTREAGEGELDEQKMAALNALMQMDAERAVPLLEKVLQKREAGSAKLREHAVFLLSQHPGPETTALLVDVVKNDPHEDVRGSAVFWLSQAGGEEAIDTLIEILHTTKDRAIREKAIFSIAQAGGPRALETLRSIATDPANGDLRGEAVFWIGQQEGDEIFPLLSQLFRETEDREIKEKVLFSMSQHDDPAAFDWIIGVAKNPAEDLELRKNALFWAGQNERMRVADLRSMYASFHEREMREQIIFVATQSESDEAIDFLLELARQEKDPELQQNVIFWLGQSDDPRALDLLEEIINR